MKICPICDCGDTREERVYLLPNALKELGYSGYKWAHVRCVTVDKTRVERTASRRGISSAMVVQQRQNMIE